MGVCDVPGMCKQVSWRWGDGRRSITALFYYYRFGYDYVVYSVATILYQTYSLPIIELRASTRS